MQYFPHRVFFKYFEMNYAVEYMIEKSCKIRGIENDR